MHVIARKAILEFGQAHPDSVKPLDAWYRIARKALWKDFNEVKSDYPHASLVCECVAFNIGGNKYRLITSIAYASPSPPRDAAEGHRFRGKIFVLYVLTHAEYDEDQWKAGCGC